MPYTSTDELPESVRKLPAAKQRQWRQVWQSAYKRCTGKGGEAKACETSAFAQANGVVGHSATFSADEPLVADVVEFGLDAADTSVFEHDGTVYRNGRLFRAGEYPDKNFTMTPAELANAVEKFEDSAPIDLEHMPTLLDGQLGEVVSLTASEDGLELWGTVAIPKWLDTILPERKVSATWDRDSKTLVGLALVRNPRVEDAALMAAFAESKRHDTHEGQSALQNVHDETARRGAVCRAPAEMASKHEASAMQKVHDLTAEHGARCSAVSSGSRSYPWFSGSQATNPPKEGTKMSRFDEFMAWLKADGTEAAEPTTVTASATPAPAQPAAPETVTLSQAVARIDPAEISETNRLREEVRKLKLQGIQDRAVAFADKAEAAGHITPAQKAGVIAMHAQVERDDTFNGTADFAEGKSRTSLYEESVLSQPAHLLNFEALPRALDRVIAMSNSMETQPTTSDGPMTLERRRELMSHDPVSRAAFAEKYGEKVAGTNGIAR